MTDRSERKQAHPELPTTTAQQLFEEFFEVSTTTSAHKRWEKRSLKTEAGTAEVMVSPDGRDATLKVNYKTGAKLTLEIKSNKEPPFAPTLKYTLTSPDKAITTAEGDGFGYQLKFSKKKGHDTLYEGTYTRDRGWEKGPGGPKKLPDHMGEEFTLYHPITRARQTVDCYNGQEHTSTLIRGTESHLDSWSWPKRGRVFQDFHKQTALLRDTLKWSHKPSSGDTLDELMKRWIDFDFEKIMSTARQRK